MGILHQAIGVCKITHKVAQEEWGKIQVVSRPPFSVGIDEVLCFYQAIEGPLPTPTKNLCQQIAKAIKNASWYYRKLKF